MADLQDSPDASAPDAVSFDTGCIGCLVVILMIGAGLFGIAAFDEGLFTQFAETRAPRNWLGVLAPFRSGGVNVAVLLLVAYILFQTFRMARKFVDPRAVWMEGDTIRFHPSLRRKPLPLGEVTDVKHEAGDVQSVLVLRRLDGRHIKVAMVNPDAAAAFVAEVARRRGPVA